jgi:hypothetical protein
MAEPEVEAAWRAEFTRIHDTEAFQNASDDPKAAFRWSGDEAEKPTSKSGRWRSQSEIVMKAIRSVRVTIGL